MLRRLLDWLHPKEAGVGHRHPPTTVEGPEEIDAREYPASPVRRPCPIVRYPIVWHCGVPGCVGGHHTKDGARFCRELGETMGASL